MRTGSIVFGPSPGKEMKRYSGGYGSLSGAPAVTNVIACNCIGAQPGQTKCPCKLRAESELGRKMIDEGVTIDGKRYRLVLE